VANNPDQLLATGERGVIISGDTGAAAAAGKGKDKTPKIKKIPHDQRSTTPYMTKYEKARILGTRALQIRFVLLQLLETRIGGLMCRFAQYERSSSC